MHLNGIQRKKRNKRKYFNNDEVSYSRIWEIEASWDEVDGKKFGNELGVGGKLGPVQRGNGLLMVKRYFEGLENVWSLWKIALLEV